MSRDDSVFLYLGVYDDTTGAEDDYAAVKQLHRDRVIGSYDAVIVTKVGDSVKIHKHEVPALHLWRGLSRRDLRELGDELSPGEAAMIVMAKDTLDQELDKMYRQARRTAQKQLHVDLNAMQKDIEAAFAEATRS